VKLLLSLCLRSHVLELLEQNEVVRQPRIPWPWFLERDWGNSPSFVLTCNNEKAISISVSI